ncbi:MAG: 3-methyl-2-oxobutanoate hydroxymethyltransferase, partial [Planctomycetota bacterium]|nr:3-methyl-2-oxobutanoate hydroxymethyltransferase [Planctomycetota bacterium]
MSTLPPNLKTQIAHKKITTLAFRQKKERGEPIAVLTGYDYPTALALDQAGIDAILVGD